MNKHRTMILFALLTLSFAVTALADPLARNQGGTGEAIQGAAWSGAKAAVLTIYGTVTSFVAETAYAVYSSVTCYERWMPTETSPKAAYTATPINPGEWHRGIVNQATPFGNLSGCNGFIKKM